MATSKAAPTHYGHWAKVDPKRCKNTLEEICRFANIRISFAHCVNWRYQFVNRLSETIWPDFLMPIIRQHRGSFEVMVRIYYTIWRLWISNNYISSYIQQLKCSFVLVSRTSGLMKWSWTTHILWRVSKRNYFFHYKKQFQELLQKIVIMKGFFQLCSPQYNNVGHLNSDPYWRHLSPVCKLTYIRVWYKKNYLH